MAATQNIIEKMRKDGYPCKIKGIGGMKQHCMIFYRFRMATTWQFIVILMENIIMTCKKLSGVLKL